MRKGSIVKITDGSYNITIEDNKIGKVDGNVVFNSLFEVIQKDIVIHSKCNYSGTEQKLDVMLKEIGGDRIIFTKSRYLKVVCDHTSCPVCGRGI